MEKSFVGIVGMGTVGAGVAKLLLDHGDRTARHAGRTLWLQHVVVRDVLKKRDVDLPEGVLTDDLKRLLNDSEVSSVAMLVGGVEPARTIALKILEAGKDLVTANKALLAEHGPELFDLARELGRSIAFEAAVAGGIPIITNLAQCLNANKIISISGILNGTTNFILSRMDRNLGDYDSCLAQAQKLGFAEADPTMDVDGSDAAQKLAILAHLAFGAQVHWADIPRRGIENLNADDFRYARQVGHRIKLIALAELTETGLQLEVAPMLVKIGTPLAEVQDNFNAIRVTGDAVGSVFYHGQGAGQMPTASAVVADMIDTAVGRTKITFQTLKLWSDTAPTIQLAYRGDSRSRYYFRLNITDQSNILAPITKIMGKFGISIASVFQHDDDRLETNIVPLVIMTHETSEQNANAAFEEINQLDFVHPTTERLKVLNSADG
ncbi:MAG: homoserine dehydrogenase [Pirellulaceae bacterium]|nr:homoserine dehydrogenase [Pirellulaceae bacterium]